ncbi:glucosaminidase domain-containing protein [Maribacter sp. 2304DJ31-5]|uniref:glucosaminidase domain-containing protein n=1 Tax=Maribacter sp. 2304DJ31-5 TaxID=3386273 RepID=UPI0039BCEBE7
MNTKFLVLFVFGIFLIGCKSKKAYSDKLRTKNVRAARKNKKPVNTYPTDTSLPEDSGRFVEFRIESIPEYIKTFSAVAQEEMRIYDIPASITLAQGLLESGYGKGELALKTNNHFGIKCHKGWQGDYDFHDDDEKGECFRKYNHPMSSFRDHSIFLTTRSRYAFLFDYKNTDYKSWAKGLRKAGYATDKKYPQKLIYLIEKHQLYTYDREVVKGRRGKRGIAAADTNTIIHVVEKGDTLYSLSKKYYMSVEELMQMNNLRDSLLSIGQKLKIKNANINK